MTDALRRARPRADRGPRARVLPGGARPGRRGRPPPLRRRALAGLHRGRRLRSTRDRPPHAPLVRRARPRGVCGEPRVHELAVRDQRKALRRARRRRPRVHAQGRRKGDRRAGGAPRDLHGPAVRRSGRLGLPPPHLAPGRGRPQRVRGRGRAGRAQPAGRGASSPASSSTRGAPGAARADGERVQADPPGQPRADPRQLGPRQPHGDVPRAAGARSPLARRDPDR